MPERKHIPRQPADLRARGVRPLKENRSNCSSETAAYASIMEKPGCSRFANSASRRSATPESGRDGAAPTMPESRSWSARPRDCAPPSRNRAKIASSCRNQELRLNSFRSVLLRDAVYGNHESCGAKIRHIVARAPQLAHRLVSEPHGVLQS